MCDISERSECRQTTNSCAVCSGRFGLVRFYAWRTAVCSKKCLVQLRARRERDRLWLFRLPAASRSSAGPIV
jgi:hypothetical protein